jgi:signal transduction histidine kinase
MLKAMTHRTSPPPARKTRLAALTKAELIACLESLPCSPEHRLETCPVERLKLELSTHEVELETQNEELRASQAIIEEARDRYSNLYEFAPVGYVTLDKLGYIQEINLTGAAKLDSNRSAVLGKPLILWLEAESHGVFHQHIKHVFTTSDRVVDEVLLHCTDAPPRHISLVSNTVTHGPEAMQICRTALVDITPLKDKETELTLSRQQLRNLSAHMDQVREDERRRLAREIHDELGQKLTSLRFEVAMLNTGMTAPPSDWAHSTASLLKLIDETIESVRTIASDLRPAVLDLGLAAAIEWQVQELRRRTGIACLLKLGEQEIRLDDARATAIFRIVQESLTNIVRHAQASQIKLSLRQRGDRLLIQIGDNGVGMTADAMQQPRSFGIAGMRERVLLLDGSIEINSRPGRGTQLKVSIPLQDRRKAAGGRRKSETQGERRAET